MIRLKIKNFDSQNMQITVALLSMHFSLIPTTLRCNVVKNFDQNLDEAFNQQFGEENHYT